jgi:hypothetical protein
MRGCLVTLCVAIAVALLTGCESTKSPKLDPPATDDAKVAAPIGPATQVQKLKADDAKPASSDVPTAPLAMEKLEAAAEDEGAEGDVVSLPDAFPERRLPAEKLSDKMVKRIRYKLRDVTKAPIALRHFIQVPGPDGSVDVFAIYEYGELESCVRGYPTRKEGRAACLEQLPSLDCVRLGAVRAHFGAPRPGASMETSGALTVWSMAFEDTKCSAAEELAFVDDVDRDGKLEMLIDLTTSYTEGGERTPAEHGYQRSLYVFPGADGSEPFQLDVDTSVIEDGVAPPSVLGSEISMGDFNRDGHMDFLHSLAPDCPELDSYGSSNEEWQAKQEACGRKPRGQKIYLYDLKLDQWEESSELSEARYAAEVKASEAAIAEAAEQAKEAAADEAKKDAAAAEKPEQSGTPAGAEKAAPTPAVAPAKAAAAVAPAKAAAAVASAPAAPAKAEASAAKAK